MSSHNSKLSFINYRVCTLFEQTIQGLFNDFQVFPQHEQFYLEGLSVFAPFSLEFYIHYKVSIEIQELSSSDCNDQGLSRPQIFILKFKDF